MRKNATWRAPPIPHALRVLAISAVLAFAAGCASPTAHSQPATARTPEPSASPSMFSRQGYIDRSAYVDSAGLLPPPPEANSPAMARDEAARAAALEGRDTQRWMRAVGDADLRRENPPDIFSCAAGRVISAESTPRTQALLMRSGVDFGLSAYRAKNLYARTRPFAAHGATSCTPGDQVVLQHDGSYPSGHAAIGWGWALILAELIPEQADSILQRGLAFGQSRVICDVHWQSDVEAGQLLASATYARLHADPGFASDLAAAREEMSHAARRAPDESVCRAL